MTTKTTAAHLTRGVAERREGNAGAREALRHAPGVILVDDPAAGEFPMPIDAVGTDVQFVSPRPFQLMHEKQSCASSPPTGSKITSAPLPPVSFFTASLSDSFE